MTEPEEETGLRVRAARDSEGRIVGFQDPDFGNRFITRSEAIERLSYDSNKSQIVDSFGNPVGVGALAFPGRGEEVAFRTKIAQYFPMEGLVEDFKPKANQEIVERITVINKDGSLSHHETSYGLGEKWDSKERAGWWRTMISNDRGLKPGERLPSSDLAKFVLRKDYIVKTISD